MKALMAGLLLAGVVLSGCGSDRGCYFQGRKCVTGSSYAGDDGELVCIASGGSMVDSCPAADCIGKCVYDSHATWYYSPAYTVTSAEKGCTATGAAERGSWTTSCP